MEGLWLAKIRKKKQLKVNQSIQARVYLGFVRPKTGTMRFGPMAGLVGCAFDLILECTCFWPQTDQVYLILAASQRRSSTGGARTTDLGVRKTGAYLKVVPGTRYVVPGTCFAVETPLMGYI